MNIKNILVPVDFSPPSRLAVNHGVSLARQFRGRLTLMHVVEGGSAAIESKHREQSLRMLSALLAPEDQDDLDLRIVIRSGDIKDEISAVIRDEHADMVVMGTHGRGLFGRWLIGSITEGMLRQTSIPVLTVCHATRPLALKRILFATDFSESSKQGFDFALDLAHTMHSNLLILHVLDPTVLTYGGAEMDRYVSKHNLQAAKVRLAEFAAEGVRAKVKIETAAVEGSSADEILKAADNYEADLILLPVHKKGMVERALLGTTAERVIREANVPVLSFPTAINVDEEHLAELQRR